MGIKVTLRKKPISKKRYSLYLDFYPAIEDIETGQLKRREFLGLYIHEKPKDPIEKKHNQETNQLAKQIEQLKHNALNKPEIYSDYEKQQLRLNQKGEEDFVKYFKKLTDRRKNSNHDNWVSSYKYLLAFTEGHKKFCDIDLAFCEGFKDYLLTTKSRKSEKVKLARNSAVSYFNKFKAALREAYQEDYFAKDINTKVSGIDPEETHRDFLNLEELNNLIKTPCNTPILKRAALFSALTGLRFSDIEKLTWSEIRKDDKGNCSIVFRQKKTKGAEVLPIGEQALSLLGERSEGQVKVFEGLKYSAYHNKHLFQWLGAAGITKDITFHCFRHTYAVLQLDSGTDIFTVSKMLGHKDLKTTQIYAKVLNKAKSEAANKIKLNF